MNFGITECHHSLVIKKSTYSLIALVKELFLGSFKTHSYMKKLLLSFALVQSCIVVTFCQESKLVKIPSEKRVLQVEKNSSKTPSLQERVSQMEGTYQIQTTNKDYQPLFTEDLVSAIENGRRSNEDITITWGEFSKIYIPSEASISKKDFIPLAPTKYLEIK
jgi:hypothetical protein